MVRPSLCNFTVCFKTNILAPRWYIFLGFAHRILCLDYEKYVMNAGRYFIWSNMQIKERKKGCG